MAVSCLRIEFAKESSRFLTYFIIFITTLCITVNLKNPDLINEENCNGMMSNGRYLDNSTGPHRWQPYGCVMNNYTRENAQHCFPKDTEIMFLGDSTSRRIFFALQRIFDSAYLSKDSDGIPKMYDKVRMGVKSYMTWSEYLNNTEAIELFETYTNRTEKPKNVFAFAYITTGLWFCQKSANETKDAEFIHNVDEMIKMLKRQNEHSWGEVFWGPVQPTYFARLWEDKRNHLYPGSADNMIAHTDQIFGHDPKKFIPGTLYKDDGKSVAARYLPVFNKIGGQQYPEMYDESGIHYTHQTTNLEINVMLNQYCNKKIFEPSMFPHNVTCCMKYPEPTAAVTFFIPIGIIAGIILSVFLTVREFKLFRFDLKSAASLATFTLLSVLYAYYADRTHAVNKMYFYFNFYQLSLLLQGWVVVSFCTLSSKSSSKSSSSSLLSGVSSPEPHKSEYTKTDDDVPLSPVNKILAAGEERESEKFWDLDSTLLREFQGIITSAVLILGWTGAENKYFNGEVMVKILTASWIFAEIYEFSKKCLNQKVTLKAFGIQIARASLLPVLLSTCLGAPLEFYHVGVNLSFWLTFIYITFCLMRAEGYISSLYTSQIQGLKAISLMVIWFFIIKFEKHFALEEFISQAQLYSDYWVIGSAVIIAWSNKVIQKALASDNTSPSLPTSSNKFSRTPPLITLCSVVCLVYLIHFLFLSATFSTDQHYTMPWHVIFTLTFIFCYTLIRNSFPKDKYLRVWTWVSAFSFEILALRNHVFLANDGTARLSILNTGTVEQPTYQHRIQDFTNFFLVIGTLFYLSHTMSKFWNCL